MNFNLQQNSIEVEKFEEFQQEWQDFNKQLNNWKKAIEREIRKSDEYDSVISDVENVLTKIKQCEATDPKLCLVRD